MGPPLIKPDPQSFVALLAVELPLLCRLPFGLIPHPLPTLRSLFPLKFLLLYLVLQLALSNSGKLRDLLRQVFQLEALCRMGPI